MVAHASAALNRRDAIKALGGLALAGTTPLRAAHRGDVTVVGAGLAGLYSAMLLEEQGFTVRLLEASQRVGGRVNTRTIGDIRHELGASDIGVMYARVLDLMSRLGLKRVPSGIAVRPFVYHIGGELVRAEDWSTARVNRTVDFEREIPPARLESQLLQKFNPLVGLDDWLDPSNASLDVPVRQYLTEHGVSDAAIELAGLTMNGNGTNRTSALSLLRDSRRTQFGIQRYLAMRQSGSDVAPLSQVDGGNERLPEAMAEALDTPVALGKTAAWVEQGPSRISIGCLDGTRYTSDFVVMAIPLTALARLRFSPRLSAPKAAIASQMDYYASTKFYVRAKRPFWNDDGFEASMWTDGPIERVFALTDSRDDVHTLLVWINGQGSQRIDQLGPSAARQLVLEEFARLRPASRGQLDILDHHAWGLTPFVGGCGHSFTAGQIGRFANDLPEPEGRVHFAGEHTRRTEFGMEAALASAERVVGEILRAA